MMFLSVFHRVLLQKICETLCLRKSVKPTYVKHCVWQNLSNILFHRICVIWHFKSQNVWNHSFHKICESFYLTKFVRKQGRKGKLPGIFPHRFKQSQRPIKMLFNLEYSACRAQCRENVKQKSWRHLNIFKRV